MSGKGIAIMSELQAASSHKSNRFLTWEMFRALKHHMLHKMGHAAFIILLDDASSLHQKSEINFFV